MDKAQNKKKRIILKAVVISIFASIGLAGVFVIVALATQDNENINDAIFFVLAIMFLVVALVAFLIYFRLLRSRWYAQHQLDTRLENFYVYREKEKIPEYVLPFAGEFDKEKFDVLFDLLLHDFTRDELGGGIIYYTLGANVFNKTKNSIDVFYFVSDKVKNTLGLVSEKFALAVYIKQVEEFLAAKFDDTQFINCVIVFLHDELSPKGKDFYHNFAGENSNLTAQNGVFIQNKFFNYLGIEKSTLNAYFYFPLESDSGNIADLGHLIEDILLAEKPKTELQADVDEEEPLEQTMES